jgi:hypothetical protein
MRQEDARIHLTASPGDLLHRSRIRKDRDRFQKTLPLLRGNQNSCGDAVARDLNRLTAFFDAAEQFE